MKKSPENVNRKNGTTPALIRDILLTTAARFGDRTAYMQKEDGTYKRYSFRRYRSDVEALGTALLCMGLAGKKILIAGENGYPWVLSYMAVVSGVGIAVPVDPTLSREELVDVAAFTGAEAILYSDTLEEKVKDLPESLCKLPFSRIHELIADGRIALNRGVSDLFHTELDADAPAVLLFTADASGMSKCITLTNANITWDVGAAYQLIDADENDIFFSVLPLHHAYESTLGFLGALYLGAAVAFCENLGHMVKNMSETKPTILIGVPMLLETLYRRITADIARRGLEKKVHAAVKATDLMGTGKMALTAKRKLFADLHRILGGNMRLLISVGAAISPATLDGLTALGLPAIQGYGLTECAPLVAINPTCAPKSASAGVALPGGTVDIYNVQEDGTGEIRYKGKNVMPSYYNMPELTDEVKRGEWFYTGDLGYMDKDGYLYITGRKKNIIVTASGKNIFPEELETALCRTDFVREAVVVGFINNQKRDCDLVAVLHPDYDKLRSVHGENFTLSDINRELGAALETVNATVKPYKRMAMFVIREQPFEKTSSRKIKRSGVAPSVIDEYRRKLDKETEK